jgi:hypothetical protein
LKGEKNQKAAAAAMKWEGNKVHLSDREREREGEIGKEEERERERKREG